MAVPKHSRGIGAAILILSLSWSCTSAFVTPRPLIQPKIVDMTRYSSAQCTSLYATKQQSLDGGAQHEPSRWTRWCCRQGLSSLMKQRQRPASTTNPSKKRNQRGIFAAALLFVSLLKPKRVLAAMGGGMGGSKGPIAPMAK